MNRMLTRIMLVVGLGLVLASGAFLLPILLRLRQVESEIKDYQGQLREQEMVKPLRADLDRIILQRQPEGLEAPVRAPMRSAELPSLADLFLEPARQAELKIVQISPDVQTLTKDGYRQLDVTVTVTGDFQNFHPYLISICRLPALAELRRVAIRRVGPEDVQMTVFATLYVQS